MIAIQTRMYGPTNHKPARIKAWTCNGHRVWITLEQVEWFTAHNPKVVYESCYDKQHRMAAIALCSKMGYDNWNPSKLVGGSVKDGMVWVFRD